MVGGKYQYDQKQVFCRLRPVIQQFFPKHAILDGLFRYARRVRIEGGRSDLREQNMAGIFDRRSAANASELTMDEAIRCKGLDNLAAER